MNTLICSNCSENCLECPSLTFCDQCATNYIWDELSSKCVLNCPIFTYKNTTTGKCEECKINCLKCTNSSNCQACNSKLLLWEENCYNICPDTLYEDYKENLCRKCSTICGACNGPSKNDCTSCAEESNLEFTGAPENTCKLKECNIGQYFEQKTKICTSMICLFSNLYI